MIEKICSKIVNKLKEQGKTISFMESCTGGFLANQITNISGASEVLKVSLVTYSNEYKVKFGVDNDIINNYNVYSTQTANQMAKKLSEFSNCDISVGTTGELGNTINKTPKVYYSIYFAKQDKYINKTIEVQEDLRENMKRKIAEYIFKDILNVI